MKSGGIVVYSQLRTYRCNALTDAICQQETHAPHQIASQAASCYVSSRYGFLRKLDRTLSANQNTKIAANDTQKYILVHKRAFPAFVIALSLASKKDSLNGTIADNGRTDVAINQFGQDSAGFDRLGAVSDKLSQIKARAVFRSSVDQKHLPSGGRGRCSGFC